MLWHERRPTVVRTPESPRRMPPPAAIAWAAALFVGGQALLLSAFYGWKPEARDPEYGGKLLRLQSLRAAKPGAPLIAVLGSSRVAMGFRPDALNSLHTPDGRDPIVFNYALVGSGPVFQLFCLKRLLNDGVRPDWVFVEYWPAFYDQDAERAEETRIDVNRLTLRDFSVLDPYCRQPDGLRRRWWEAQLAPIHSHRFLLVSRYAPAWLPWMSRLDGNWAELDAYGWLPWVSATDASKPGDRLRRAREYYEPLLKLLKPSALSDRALRELAATCQQHGIRLALLYMPESLAFADLYPPAVRTQTDSYIRGIAQELGVPLCDARSWVADEEFIDGFHLLPAGAKTFSERFGREVIEPLLGASPSNKLARTSSRREP
jgi:hypothetical protein